MASDVLRIAEYVFRVIILIHMKKIFDFIKNNKTYFLIGLVVLMVVFYFIFRGNGAGKEAYTVKNTDIVQSVTLSGKVQTSDRADLGFADSGRLGRIYVQNNQNVLSGQILAQLEIGDLLADLKIKQANAKASDVDLESAKDELEKVTTTEDTKVANAYRTLLSEDLTLVPNSNDYDVDVPSVSGLYDGLEGQYKIVIDRENFTSTDFIIRTFGLERTERIINESGPTPLGTKGLYISFPGNDLSSYFDTVWFLDIPNKSSSSYLANYNAYNEAKKQRDSAVKEAEFKYKKLLTEIETGGSTVAQAEIDKINAEIRKNTIYAPFAGKVTNIEKEIGENASIGERIISILGEEKLEVVLQVSELDVSKIAPSSTIKLTLDAFPGEEFLGILKTINSRDTEIDGVPVYEAFVELPADPRIKTGMSANGTVVLSTKNNVPAIPVYLIKQVGDKNIVGLMLTNGDTEEREVTLGLLGTDSMIEITSGLKDGDRVIANGKK